MHTTAWFFALTLAAHVATTVTANAAPKTTATSARRNPKESYHSYLERSRARSNVKPAPFGKLSRASAVGDQASAYVGDGALRPAPEWENNEVMQLRFEAMRDARALHFDGDASFPRRATWLFPDDGCYARAAVGIHILSQVDPPARAPGKIFVFGNLAVQSPNALSGTAYWWYHVAPVVRVAGITFVLDPAIEPARPLTVAEWIGRQSKSPESVQVAICGTGAYLPEDRCDSAGPNPDALATSAEQEFLDLEWRRLIELDRDPRTELGDTPPWKH